jgi:hypothetical protein
MKVFEMKNELEKVAKVVPKLREELDEVYSAPTGRKTRIKLLWKQYESKHKELRESREHKNLNLH